MCVRAELLGRCHVFWVFGRQRRCLLGLRLARAFSKLFACQGLRLFGLHLGIVGRHGCSCTVQKVACLFTHVSCQCAESGAQLRRRSSFLLGRFCAGHVCSQKQIDHQERVTHEGLSNTITILTTTRCALTLFAFSSKVVISRLCSNPNVSLDSLCPQEELVPASYFGRQKVQSTFQGTSKILHGIWRFFLACRTSHWESGWR